MPPSGVRRPLTVICSLIASAAWLVLSPLVLTVAIVIRRLRGPPQPLIVARLGTAYAVRELATLVGCGVLWVASGGGYAIRGQRFELMHWALLRWFVHGLSEQAISLLGVDVAAQHPPDVTAALRADEPLIVLSRHAGPGDTILLIDQLLSRFDRRPSVVLKEAVLAEPCVDLLAHRLPHAVLDTSEREESKALIEELARRLGARGVLLLFPEGANFTPELRRSAVARLRRKGRIRAAAKADRLSHVMPPHPAGALAALRGRPSADLIFAAHTGLGLAVRPRDLWKNMPIGRTLHTRMWLVRSTAIPSDPEAQTNWLEDWWARIDSWIDNQHSRHCSREASNV